MKTNKILLALCCFMTISVQSHCQKYANEFLNNQKDALKRETVYLLPTDNIIRTDNVLTQAAEDSLLKDIFIKEFSSQLEFLGFEVKTVSSLPKLNRENESAVIISQLEAEEFEYYDSVVSEGGGDMTFYKKLSACRFNAWLTYNNATDTEQFVFYNDVQVNPDFDGYFEKESPQNIYVNYEITEINPNDAYAAAFNNAHTSAVYFFNFLMNRYVFLRSQGSDKNYYGVSEFRSLITRKTPFDNFDIVE
ncbi:MAG: hypothetical protein J6M30_04875 [Bacteroidales bacterium]|nr:hypothetical protein [Bacteroidales bacterium]